MHEGAHDGRRRQLDKTGGGGSWTMLAGMGGIGGLVGEGAVELAEVAEGGQGGRVGAGEESCGRVVAASWERI